MRSLIAAILLLAACVVAFGCTCRPRGGSAVVPVARGTVPGYDEVAAAYNARVDPLVRLWARTVVRLKFIDGEGKPREEQVEGFLQYVRPAKALVTFHKVSHVLAMLGSDGERYWWIELDPVKRAMVGRHSQATAERIASAGLRVHPLDLMELMGLTPLPTTPTGTTAWSEDGRWIVVTLPGRSGLRRVMVDPGTFEPGRVEVVEQGGRVVATSALRGFARVSLKGAGPEVPRPRVPTSVVVEVDEGATRIIMDLSEPQDDPARFKPIAFDLPKLLAAYGVEEVVDLDARAEDR